MGNQDIAKLLRELLYKEVDGIARIDHGRRLRAGKPEAILAEFKEPEEVVKIAREYLEVTDSVLITRASKKHVESLKGEFGGVCDIKINEKGRTVILSKEGNKNKKEKVGKVAILTAGTSDIPVAEEAASTAEFLGMDVLKFYDVGVAGIHRLIEPIRKICEENVDAIIVIAGMEGALPSVVSGLVDIPVIAVPTSIGYGTNFGGLTALFAMLQSCSSGVAVVNIDNGFGAAVFAYLIARKVRKQ
jgi:NCAIR mutase (PurE)-related protein